jgi:2-methylcitrate dehydratase PrpD
VPETHIERLAAFAANTTSDKLPAEVADEAKRVLLDSIGCALASANIATGRMGIDYGRILGGSRDEATIIGLDERTSVHGAAFANAELISALDLHSVSLPGHVAPYVVPVVLALGENRQTTGAQVVSAIAVCQEISFRFSRAMDRNRDIKDGKADTSPVLGYASTTFGVAAAAAMMKTLSEEQIANALGIAGSTSPVNAHRAWLMHAPTTTVKYNLMPGSQTFNGLTSAFMAELGHRGDKMIVDDSEFGYARYIGTRRWEPSQLTTDLGSEWGYVATSFFKPYPHCRVTHAVLDALIEVVRENDIKPDEIESLTAYGEQWASDVPTFMNRTIERPYDAQFSFPHGLSMAAHLVPPGKEWQNADNVYSTSVMDLMSKVVWRSHPDWATAVSADPAARPARVEVSARGTTFVGERSYPKGSRSPDPTTYMTTDEVVAKFLYNASEALQPSVAEWMVDRVLHLEDVEDASTIMSRLRPGTSEVVS